MFDALRTPTSVEHPMYSACDSGHALSTRTGHHETYPGKNSRDSAKNR
jgi:hypothetical protein